MRGCRREVQKIRRTVQYSGDPARSVPHCRLGKRLAGLFYLLQAPSACLLVESRIPNNTLWHDDVESWWNVAKAPSWVETGLDAHDKVFWKMALIPIECNDTKAITK